MTVQNPLSDIFALWPSEIELARDMGVSRNCARMWIVRLSLPMRYWATFIFEVASRFDRVVTYRDLAEARLARMEREAAASGEKQDRREATKRAWETRRRREAAAA